jgi:uncharacterized protein with HEPN domain
MSKAISTERPNLSSRPPDQSLRDILNSIILIEEFIADVSFDRFCDEPMRIAAVERHLQKISEAAVRLSDQAEILCPGVPWRNIRGIGNFLRHEYDRVDLDTVWHTATDNLPPLKAAVMAALQKRIPPS